MHARTREVLARSRSGGSERVLDAQGRRLLLVEVRRIVRTIFDRLYGLDVRSDEEEHDDGGVEQDGGHGEDGFGECGHCGAVDRCVDTRLRTRMEEILHPSARDS